MYKIRNWGNTLKKELKGMKSTKTKKIRREDIPNLETSERVKYEIAEELGLLDKVLDFKKCEYFATFVEKALYV